MLNAILIEKQRLNGNFESYLSQVVSEVCIKTKLHTVKEGIQYFSENNDADLIFSEIQLSDGLSFDIFFNKNLSVPIFFFTDLFNHQRRTAENNLQLLPENGPGKNYYDTHSKYFDFHSQFRDFLNSPKSFNNNMSLEKRKISRILGKKGIVNFALRIEDVILFYTEHKAVYAIDKDSKKYIIDKTISDLENQMDHELFFRANRQFLVNINYIKSFRVHKKVNLLVETTLPDFHYPIIISQNISPLFKKWIAGN